MPPNNNNVVIDSSLANHGENEMDNLYRSSTVNISVVNHLLAWMKLPDNINNNAIIEATISAVSDILLGIYRQFKNTRSKEARLHDKSYFQQFGGATNIAHDAVQPMIAKMFAEHGGNGVNHQQVVAELEEKISALQRANDALVQENATIREERDALLQQRNNNNQQEEEEDELSDDESTGSVDEEDGEAIDVTIATNKICNEMGLRFLSYVTHPLLISSDEPSIFHARALHKDDIGARDMKVERAVGIVREKKAAERHICMKCPIGDCKFAVAVNVGILDALVSAIGDNQNVDSDSRNLDLVPFEMDIFDLKEWGELSTNVPGLQNFCKSMKTHWNKCHKDDDWATVDGEMRPLLRLFMSE